MARRRAGRYDHVVEWKKTGRLGWIDAETARQVPATLRLRELRVAVNASLAPRRLPLAAVTNSRPGAPRGKRVRRPRNVNRSVGVTPSFVHWRASRRWHAALYLSRYLSGRFCGRIGVAPSAA